MMFARTERLMLRPGWIEDAPELAVAIGDEAILTKLARAPSPYQVQDARDFLSLPRAEDHADFLMFARFGSRGDTRESGSGLGLAFVRAVVQRHRGEIDCASAPGMGTRFTITLPIVDLD